MFSHTHSCKRSRDLPLAQQGRWLVWNGWLMSTKGPSPLTPVPRVLGRFTDSLLDCSSCGGILRRCPSGLGTLTASGALSWNKDMRAPSAWTHHSLHVNKTSGSVDAHWSWETALNTPAPHQNHRAGTGREGEQGGPLTRVSKQEACALKTLQFQDEAGHGEVRFQSLSLTPWW